MGPISLFDKSFLQAISLHEVVWFDRFFMPVVCPIFFVQTLADLGKDATRRGSAEFSVVKDIAQKFPEMGGSPWVSPSGCQSLMTCFRKRRRHIPKLTKQNARLRRTRTQRCARRAVEEILFAGVAGPFRPDIATLRLRAAHVDKADSNARRKALEKEGQVYEAGSIAADVLNQLSRNAAHHCGIATAGEPGHAGQGGPLLASSTVQQ